MERTEIPETGHNQFTPSVRKENFSAVVSDYLDLSLQPMSHDSYFLQQRTVNSQWIIGLKTNLEL